MGSYSPPWASHVTGTFTERVHDEDGNPEPQIIEMACSKCEATWKTECLSGAVRRHIQNFAAAHAHRDILREKIPR